MTKNVWGLSAISVQQPRSKRNQRQSRITEKIEIVRSHNILKEQIYVKGIRKNATLKNPPFPISQKKEGFSDVKK